jgi:cobalt/nickel transport system permease protein
MLDLVSAWSHLHLFDELAAGHTSIHRVHPLAKLLVTLAFLVTTVSFEKYAVGPLLPLLLYPVVIISLADLPMGLLFKRMLLAAPFVLSVAVFNPVFDQGPLFALRGITVSGGWVSFSVIMLKFGLTVLAALLLIATSGMNEVAAALLRLKAPRPIVIQLLFMYRYLSVLGEETLRTLRAYSLRSPYERGVRFRVWGSLAGQLLLRAIDRATRIYQAMRCRGFDGEIRLARTERFRRRDALYLIIWCAFFLLARLVDLPALLGMIVLGGF